MPASDPFEFHSTFRFEVYVEDILSATFTECTLPTLQVETLDIKEGGQNEYIHRLPVRVNAGTVKLRHGFTSGNVLLSWYLQVLTGDISSAIRQVSVVLNDVTGEQVALWNFRDAYPIKWSGPTLKADSHDVAIEELELAHHGFVVG
jgi:phage tail-like protein